MALRSSRRPACAFCELERLKPLGITCLFFAGVHFTVQDRLELVGEGVVTADQGFAACGKTVVSDYCWDSSEQADRGSDQGFGDTRGHSGQGRLLGLSQATEGVHEPPDGAEQPDVRADGADGSEERQALLQFLFFARNRD